MSAGPRKYRRDSLASKLVAFYEANPDEELTLADVCVKFDTPKHSAESRLCEAVRDGLLERVVVYRRPVAPGAEA
jgi:hypothetical protein